MKTETSKKKKLKVSSIIALITWLLLLGASGYFFYIFKTFKMFPDVWSIYLIAGLSVLLILLGLVVFIKKIQKSSKILVSILNILLAICLGIGSIYLPSVRSKIEIMFQTVPEEGELEINYYTLKTSGITDVAACEGKTFIVQGDVDLENQEYANMVLRRELRIEDIETYTVGGIWEGVDALREGLGDILVLNSTYMTLIQDVTGYEEFENEVDIAYTVKRKLVVSENPTESDLVNKPFSILLVGNDGWGNNIKTTGRTDVNIVATVNPQTKQVLFVSFPRDSYIPTSAANYKYKDKLTQIGAYGIKYTVASLAKYLNISIENYVIINFTTFKKIVDAVGGLDIDNPYKFSSKYGGDKKKYTFEKGKLHLSGVEALAYVRERKSIDGGDFARNEHQEIIIRALLDKITQPAIITKIDELLAALEGCFLTNVQLDSIYALCQMQLNDMAIWNMKSITLSGKVGYDATYYSGPNCTSELAAAGKCSLLSVVYLKEKSVNNAIEQIQKVLNGEILENGTETSESQSSETSN